MSKGQFTELQNYTEKPDSEMLVTAESLLEKFRQRRSIRDFSDKPVELSIIQKCIEVAATAPSGANQQPWHFAVASSSKVKSEIRKKAEKEEREFYHQRAPESWLSVLAPLGTDEHKPFLEIAPHLIVVFAETYSEGDSGERRKNYYVNESVGIATGFLIAALHQVGLATLTHTPSPMKFLNEILGRPRNERPFLVLVTGHPNDNALVPVLEKKKPNQLVSIH